MKSSFTRVLMTMNAPTGIEVSGQTVHQSVHHIAGAMSIRMIVADGISLNSLAELLDGFSHCLAPGTLLKPVAKFIHRLVKDILGLRPINIPNTRFAIGAVCALEHGFRID